MDRIKKWIKRYWWVGLLAIFAGGFFYCWKTEQKVFPVPAIKEVADKALSNSDELDRKLEAIQREVSKTRQEVKIREKKITAEVSDMDCVALAARWNRILAKERQRRVSANGTSQDRGAGGMGQ